MRPNQISIERVSWPGPDGALVHEVVLRVRCIDRAHSLAMHRDIIEQAEQGEVLLPFFLSRPAAIEGQAVEVRTIASGGEGADG